MANETQDGVRASHVYKPEEQKEYAQAIQLFYNYRKSCEMERQQQGKANQFYRAIGTSRFAIINSALFRIKWTHYFASISPYLFMLFTSIVLYYGSKGFDKVVSLAPCSIDDFKRGFEKTSQFVDSCYDPDTVEHWAGVSKECASFVSNHCGECYIAVVGALGICLDQTFQNQALMATIPMGFILLKMLHFIFEKFILRQRFSWNEDMIEDVVPSQDTVESLLLNLSDVKNSNMEKWFGFFVDAHNHFLPSSDVREQDVGIGQQI